MRKLYEDLGAVGADNLFNENEPVNDIVIVDAPADTKRGTLLTGTAGGTLAKATASINAENQYVILADDTEEAGKYEAYRAGHFNKNVVEEITGIELDAAAVDALHKMDIYLTDAVEY